MTGILLICCGLQASHAETCTVLTQAQANANSTANSAGIAANKGIDVLIQFCSEFRINSQCSSISSVYDKKLDKTQFQNAVASLKSEAIREGAMSAKEALAFTNLVDSVYGQIMTRLYAMRSLGSIQKQLAAQNCTAVNALLSLTDTALLSASQQGKTGVCNVVTTKSGKFKVTVAKKDYPMTGITYQSLTEVSGALREALDSAHCLL